MEESVNEKEATPSTLLNANNNVPDDVGARKKTVISALFGDSDDDDDDSDNGNNDEHASKIKNMSRLKKSSAISSDEEEENNDQGDNNNNRTKLAKKEKKKDAEEEDNYDDDDEAEKRKIKKSEKKKSRSSSGFKEREDDDHPPATEDDNNFIDEEDDLASQLSEDEDGRSSNRRKKDFDSSFSSRGGNKSSSSDANKDAVDLAMEKMRERKRRKSETEAMNDTQKTDWVNELKFLMDEAADNDKNSTKNSQPALAKLRALPEVSRRLNFSNMWEILLDQDILMQIYKWIQPVKKNLPNLAVRKSMYQYLLRLPIERGDLEKTGIGNLVAYVRQHPQEIRECHVLLDQILTKWHAILLQDEKSHEDKLKEDELRNADREDRAALEREEESSSARKAKRLKNENSRTRKSSSGYSESTSVDKLGSLLQTHKSAGVVTNEPGGSFARNHAVIPQPINFGFTKNVDDFVDTSRPKQLDETQERVMKRALLLRRVKKKNERALPLSVEGRGL